MKRLIILILLICPLWLFAQNRVKGYEYWFNDDYSSKIVVSISPSIDTLLNFNIPTANIDKGVHTINIRFWDDSSKYSSTLTQMFYKTLGEEIIGYEFWFNDNYDSIKYFPISSSQNINLNTLLSCSSTLSGVNALNIRFKNSANQYSSIFTQMFYKTLGEEIIGYEYWFNDNYDSSTYVSISASQNINLNTLLSCSSTLTGINTLNLRFKNSANLYSSTLTQMFYKTPQTLDNNNRIISYKYWFDTNFHDATHISVSNPTHDFVLIDSIDFKRIPKGRYILNFQFMDEANYWSSIITDTITKVSLPIAEFSETIVQNCDSTTITFNNNSIDGDTYLWNFGNNTTSTEENPIITYYSLGDYQVSLTITDTTTQTYSTTTKTFNIASSTMSNISEIACGSYTSPSGKVWTNSGMYSDTIANHLNCDSIIFIDLTINPDYALTDTFFVCYGSSFSFADGEIETNIIEDIMHISSLQTINGCDSVIRTNIIVNPLYDLNDTIEICKGESHTFHDGFVEDNITNNISHRNNLISINGCDSIITTLVSVININTTLSQDTNYLISNQEAGTYRWLNCDSGYSVIEGETSQLFIAQRNGSYAVEITLNGCVDTSDCILVTNLVLSDINFAKNIILYPNPTDNNLNIKLNENLADKAVIYDIHGRNIKEINLRTKEISLFVGDLKNGVYIIKLLYKDKLIYQSQFIKVE